MTEPRKPIFGFLWPKPDPRAPVDDAYRQVRRVRVAPRGPIRLAVLGLASVGVAVGASAAVMASLTSGFSPATVVGAAVVATAIAVLLRGWVVGTYVTDQGLSIETTWRRLTLPWTDVAAITTDARLCPFLGLPLRVRSQRAVAMTRAGEEVGTHIYATSPDLWGRPEALDIARLRLERWFEHR